MYAALAASGVDECKASSLEEFCKAEERGRKEKRVATIFRILKPNCTKNRLFGGMEVRPRDLMRPFILDCVKGPT